MKAIITDSGDPSTGMPATTYEVDCPFEKDEVVDLRYFKGTLHWLYRNYAQGDIKVMYDFEVKEIEDRILKDMEGYYECKRSTRNNDEEKRTRRRLELGRNN